MDSLTVEERRKWALINPAIFGEYYIKPYDRHWNTQTADFQFLMLEHILENPWSVIHVPIEHGKSKWCSEVLPLWFICRDRNVRMALFSNTARQAEGFLRRISWHIEYNERLKRDFPEIQPDKDEKWADQQIFVKRDPWAQSKDPTLQAIGTWGAIYGARLDIIIADDIIDISNSHTEHVRARTENWWFEMVESRCVDGGRIIVLGTLQHKQDLLCKLSENPEYSYLHLAAYNEATGEVLWPEQWPYERLMAKKRSIGTIRWKKQFQNDRNAQSGRMLKTEWLNFYGDVHNVKLPPLDHMKIYIGIDPAIADDKQLAEEKDQDYFAAAVLGHHSQSKRNFLIEMFRDRLTLGEQLDKIKYFHERYRPWLVAIGIESNAYQKALAQAAWALDSLPPVKQVMTTKSKVTRFEALSVHFENKRIWIPPDAHEFIDEWTDFPEGAHDDTIDALDIAVRTMEGKPASVLSKREKDMLRRLRVYGSAR